MTTVSFQQDVASLQRETDTFLIMLDRSAVTTSARPLGAGYYPEWIPDSLSWGTMGEPTTLKMHRVLGRGADKDEDELPEDKEIVSGTLVMLIQRGPGAEIVEMFRGWAGQSHLTIGGSEPSTLNAVAYGPELALNGKVVRGQWTKKQDQDDAELAGTLADAARIPANVFQTYLPCVFNSENGLPNCSRASDNRGTDVGWQLESKGHYDPMFGTPCRVFETPNRVVTTMGETTPALKAVHWTAYRALRSLVEWVDDYQIISYDSAPWAEIEAVLDANPMPEVNVQGMGLADAMTAVLQSVGYGWCLAPWSEADVLDAEPRYRLYVYSLSTPTKWKNPMLPPVGSMATDADAIRSMVDRLEYIRDAHNVRDEVTVVGDQVRKQVFLGYFSTLATSQLLPYWNTTKHDLNDWDNGTNTFTPEAMVAAGKDPKDFNKAYHSDGKSFSGNEHVFRSFAWNEDGHMGADTIPDLADYADAANNVMRRPRPMGPCVEYDRADAQMRHAPAQVWIGILRHGSVIEGGFRIDAKIWADHCGFTLGEVQLKDWKPWANSDQKDDAVYVGGDKYKNLDYITLLHNAIEYRVAPHSRPCLGLAIMGTVETDETVLGEGDNTGSVTWPLRAEQLVDCRDRFRKRSVTDAVVTGALADTRDDEDDAQAYAEKLVDVSAPPVAHASIMLRHITKAWVPGIGVFETDGRRISLNVSSRGDCAIVSAVNWNFVGGANKTELTLDTRLLEVTV